MLATIIIFIFTFKSKSALKRVIREVRRKRAKVEESEIKANKYLLVLQDSNKRKALIILVFLVLFPVSFIVNSAKIVYCPPVEFAYISQEDRLSSSSLDFETLEYQPDTTYLEDISIKDMFIIKSEISPGFAQSAAMRMRLIPKDVPLVEGHQIRDHYDFRSGYVNGPLEDYNLITKVELNKFDILPGQYQVDIYYTELTGFSLATSTPEEYEITSLKFINLLKKAIEMRNFQSYFMKSAIRPTQMHGVYTESD
jgi:hypothetical protein